MKAAVFLGPGRIEIQDIAAPVCGEDDVLVKVDACAICGSDVRTYGRGHSAITPPQVLGHEIAGTIVTTGPHVGNYAQGMRVVIATEVGCGACSFCRQGNYNLCSVNRRAIGYAFPGGFAEFLLVPSEAVRQGNIFPYPSVVSPDEACLAEPLACCLNAFEGLGVVTGDTVVVLGTGAMGCMNILLARMLGAGKIIAINARSKTRLELARRLPADVFVSAADEVPSDRVRAETDGRGADVIVVAASSSEAVRQAVEMASVRGRLCLFAGLPAEDHSPPMDANRIHYRELSVIGSFSASYRHYHRAVGLLSSRRLDVSPLITHRLTLDRLVEGVQLVHSGAALKVVIKPP